VNYYDSSALVKFYVTEAGSDDIRRLIRMEKLVNTAAVSGAEVPAAIAQARRMRRLSAVNAEAAMSLFRVEWAGRFVAMALDRELAAEAGDLAWRYGLHGFDAAHLASARQAGRLYGEPVTMVTYDRHLRQAALAEGMAVFPDDAEGAPPA
jgi:uncharacterized protein